MSSSSIHSLRLYAGDFPELQAQFISDMAALRAIDPLAPLVVLVPNVLCGLSLRRELARTGTSHANVRFRTVTDYARELAEPVLAERAWRMLPDVMRGPLMKRAVELAGTLRYFRRTAHRPGFHRAMWATIHELRAAGLTPKSEEAKIQRSKELKSETADKLHDIFAIWRALDVMMQSHKFADRATVIEWLCITPLDLSVHGGKLVVYGLDDLTAMERQFVSSLMRERDVLAYLPFRASDAYIWTEPLYQWYLELGFEAELLETDERITVENALMRLQSGIFEEIPSSFILHPSSVRDDSVLVISAPGRDSEVEELMREVVHSPISLASGNESCAILMRESRDYLPLIREECSRAGITGYIHECRKLVDSPAGRALHALVKLLDGEFRRSDVMEFLLNAPLRRPDYFPAELPEVPVAEWNHFSMQAMIVAGATAWREHLQRLHTQLTKELERRESELDDPASPIRQQLVSLAVFQQYMNRLITEVANTCAAKSWKELTERASALFAELVGDGEEAKLIRTELRRAELLDALGLKPDVAEFSSFIESILSQLLDREGKFEVHEPAVANISDTLGVLFDEVLLCGLVEKEFPRNTPPDPLLLDDERFELQGTFNALGLDIHIPLRSRRRHRERFLFRTALNSARRRVVLSYPRLNPVDGREWLPSTFMLRAIEAATGADSDYESLETFVRTSPQARYVSLNRLQGQNVERSVTPFQYDLARLGRALQSGAADEVADLFCSDEPFKRGLKAERARYRTREFTRYDGLIESAELRTRLREFLTSLSASKMQMYAACSFQYFIHHLLKLESPSEPAWTQPIASRARGTLMREILEQFYRNETESGRWPLTESARPRMDEMATQFFDRFEQEQIPGLPLLWDIEKGKLRRRLHGLITAEIASGSSFQPRYFNVTYGLPEADTELSRRKPFALTSEDGLEMEFRGTIDRVDVGANNTARIVDYTTAKPEKLKWNERRLVPAIEQHVARLVAAELGLDVSAFEHTFISSDDERSTETLREQWQTVQRDISRVIETIAEGIAGGQFFPSPNDDCRYCKARSACGAGRFTHKWDYDLPQTDALRVIRGERP